MKRMINFGSISQFGSIPKRVTRHIRYIGEDDNGDAMFDNAITLPVIKVVGSEKIHGANAAVCYSETDGFWIQSRQRIITFENDSYGCAAWATKHKETWMNIIHELAKFYNVNLNENVISVYFEWCGGSVQKNSAVTGLDKRAMIFQHFKVSPLVPLEPDDPLYTVSSWRSTNNIDDTKSNIFNIMNFPYDTFEVDFEHPKLSHNAMLKRVSDLEANSLVGKQFGKEGNIGEGIVCTFMIGDKLFRFKLKGEKHSSTKVKTLNPLDEAKERDKIEFANYACSASRLEQAWDATFARGSSNERSPSIKATGDFIRTVIKDIIKEEQDIILEKNLNAKECNGIISKISRRWFMKQLEESSIV